MGIKLNSIILGIIAIFLVKISIEHIEPQRTAAKDTVEVERSYAGQSLKKSNRKDT